MKLIKLDAIDSTNDFLKGLSNNQLVENFTVVTAESQTNGKGQMGAKWVSEIGKNLIVSVLIKDFLKSNSEIFDLNAVIAISILEALNDFKIPKSSIKWPNDIMSDDKKIAGILIENILKSDGTINSIIGFGLNVNQTNFQDLPKASSLKNVMNYDFDKNEVLSRILECIQKNILELQNPSKIWGIYNDQLFKKGKIMPFEDQSGNKFMGIIKQVAQNGKLQLLLENDIISEFGIKEITMLY